MKVTFKVEDLKHSSGKSRVQAYINGKLRPEYAQILSKTEAKSYIPSKRKPSKEQALYEKKEKEYDSWMNLNIN